MVQTPARKHVPQRQRLGMVQIPVKEHGIFLLMVKSSRESRKESTQLQKKVPSEPGSLMLWL